MDMNELNFYLPHLYDKEKKKYVPYLYTNIAQNVLMDTISDKTISDVLTSLIANGENENSKAEQALREIEEIYANLQSIKTQQDKFAHNA